MISLQECIDLSGVDEEAVRIIARHTHVPDIVAAEMCYTLSRTREGMRQLRRLIRSDQMQAAEDGDLQRSLRLSWILAQLGARKRALAPTPAGESRPRPVSRMRRDGAVRPNRTRA